MRAKWQFALCESGAASTSVGKFGRVSCNQACGPHTDWNGVHECRGGAMAWSALAIARAPFVSLGRAHKVSVLVPVSSRWRRINHLFIFCLRAGFPRCARDKKRGDPSS